MPDAELSVREIQVLRLCADGLSDKEIAGRLEISVHTVGHHVHRILRKLQCSNRAEAVADGYRAGILPKPVDPTRTSAGSTRGLVAVLPTGAESWRPDLEGTTSRLIGLLREALLEPTAWEPFLSELAGAFNAHLSLLTWVDYVTQRMTSITISASMHPAWIRRYDEYYVKHYPVWEVIREAPGDFFGATDDVEMPPGFTDGLFYREYMAAQDIDRGIGWTVYVDAKWVCTLFVGQSAVHGPTTPWERTLGTAFFPHVRHELRRLWAGYERTGEAGGEPVRGRSDLVPAVAAPPVDVSPAEWAEQLNESGWGAVYFDQAGVPVLANTEAECLIDAGLWLQAEGGSIRAVDERGTGLLAEALAGTPAADEVTDLAPAESLLFRSADPCRPPLRGILIPRPWRTAGTGDAGSRPQAALLLRELRVRTALAS